MNQDNINLKCRRDCNTAKTPLWRGGPAGPKSLCNACGIRFTKRNRHFEGLKKQGSHIKNDKTTNTAAEKAGSVNGLSDSFKMRLMALGRGVLLQQSSPFQSTTTSPPLLVIPPVVMKKQRCQRKRRLKEEGQAAFSVLALSCGCVFA